ncbi:MAG: tRNA uridine-5-carboxymethylaminomethyl(34) synthesis GTPase MnmE [Pseudomonadota bacterium]|jgi:tRNA modification GTPase
MDNKPIIAIATAHGSGGVGIIRISGNNLQSLIKMICGKDLEPRYATLINIYDNHNKDEFIDKVIAIYFKNPNSYTGEDILELQAHGGMVVLDMLIQKCLELGQNFGLRLAKAGEFTQRAFLNGKIDLIQAEAVADIINANSQSAAKSASLSLQGHFSKAIQELLDKLIYLRLLIESSIDFPEEELDYSHMQSIEQQFHKIIDSLNEIKQKSQQGYILHKGISIVLVGEPNVGKSSLVNALAQKDVAIVTPIAGTTRDKISIDIQIEGINVRLIDTAGLRETNDTIEEIGIQRTWQAIQESNILLYITSFNEDNNQTLDNLSYNNDIMTEILAKNSHLEIIQIRNKFDLAQASNVTTHVDNIVDVSAKTGYGLNDLRAKILNVIGYKNDNEGIFLARKRHIDSLESTAHNVDLAYSNFKYGNQLDLIAEELRIAQENLNSITGNFTSDDLLGKIFSEFCIGK